MNNEQLWKAALGQLELRVSQGNFSAWFRDTAIKDRQEGVVIIETPSPFIHEWLSKKYQTVIFDILHSLDPHVEAVHFAIHNNPQHHAVVRKNSRIVAHKNKPETVLVTKAPVVPAAHPVSIRAQAPSAMTALLNPKYTFESFVIGPSNEIAYAACKAVATKPGEAYNPLFIYGGVGLGKTHLLQAVGATVLQQNPHMRVLYVSAEKFITEFIQSIRERQTQLFKRRYREVDILIIDDVQFMAGKGKTQEELFHTFNALHGLNRQLILSSDRPPKAIPTFEERLSSRLAGGMIVDVKPPDYETRLAIIAKKARHRGVVIDEEALAFIAKNIQQNVRELEGALNKVLAHGEFSNQRITIEHTKRLLSGILEQHRPRLVDVSKILDVVSAYYNLSLDDLCGKCRKQEIVRPRQIAMYLLRKENNISFPTIGSYFGGRDHTTVMHACEKIGKLLEHNEELTQELSFIRERVYA